jgi:C-terminal processing protease CtpA/Prc
LTRPLYPRNVSPYLQPAKDPAGNVIAYSKPILLLVDENTACGAEAFAAVFQDNRRGLVVGETTQGAGGVTFQAEAAGPYTERRMTMTGSLFVRTEPAGGGGPAYIQYVGVKPDVSLNYMTKANLIDGGAAFVNGFTDLILKQLR